MDQEPIADSSGSRRSRSLGVAVLAVLAVAVTVFAGTYNTLAGEVAFAILLGGLCLFLAWTAGRSTAVRARVLRASAVAAGLAALLAAWIAFADWPLYRGFAYSDAGDISRAQANLGTALRRMDASPGFEIPALRRRLTVYGPVHTARVNVLVELALIELRRGNTDAAMDYLSGARNEALAHPEEHGVEFVDSIIGEVQ